VSREKALDGPNFHSRVRRGADEIGELACDWTGSLSRIGDGKELEGTIRLAGINEAVARPVEFFLKRSEGSATRVFDTRLRPLR
jgi:hypothetical protein